MSGNWYARYPLSGGGVISVNGQTGVVQLDAIDIPYDNTASGLAATEVQGAIDELANAVGHADSQAIYVDPDQGSDVTGTGSILNPYASINKAISVCTNPLLRYVIRLAPGDYNGVTVNWLPNVDLIGSGTSSNVQQTISYVASPGDSMNSSFSGISAGFYFDFTGANVALPTLFDGAFSITRVDAMGSGPWAIRVNDSTLNAIDLTGNNLLNNCLFVSSATIQNGSNLLCNSCTIGVQVDLYGTATINLTGCTVPGILNGITVGPDTPTVITDASSLNGTTLINMNIVLSDSATYVSYDNTISGLTATTVKTAIDEISSSTRKVELRVITGPEDAAKQLTLAATPNPANSTVLEIAGAPGQFYGVDFVVTGNVLDWSTLGLDGILAAGDSLTIIYN
jgi:trimeric autotransporter adhesin